MRSKRHPKQAAVKIPAAIEGACPSAKAQAFAVGPTGSEAASPTRAEPDRTAQPRLSVPDQQFPVKL